MNKKFGLVAPRFKHVILAISIAIVLAFFVNYTLTVLYHEPEYDEFCSSEYHEYTDRASCEASDGKWYDAGKSRPVDFSGHVKPGVEVRDCPGLCKVVLEQDVCNQANITSCIFSNVVFENECMQYGGIFFPSKQCPTSISMFRGHCDAYYTCNLKLQQATNLYRRNVFLTQIMIGGLLMVAGIALALPAVSGGIMSGAVITLFVGLVGYWDILDKWVRISILGLILVVLIWLGYKKLQK